MVLPLAEIRYEILSNFNSQVLTSVCIEAFPISDLLEVHKPYWEQLSPILFQLNSPSLPNFSRDPFTAQAVFRQNQQKAVVHLNCAVYLFVKFPSSFYIFRCRPDPEVLVAHLRVESASERLIVVTVAYEA